MSVRMRHTREHTRNRRSHHALSEVSLTRDKKTGAPARRHRVSPITGMYKGKQILDVTKKALKKEKKKEVVKEETPKVEETKEEKKPVEKKETKKKEVKKPAKKVVKKKEAKK